MKHAASRSLWLSILVSIRVFLGQTEPALPQGSTGTIAGTVTDPSGAVLKGAQVSISAQDVKVVSDEQGLFVIKDLAPGNYTLSAVR